MANDSEVGVDVAVPPDLPHVHGDRNLLNQVLLNLLLNALDAVPKGGRIQVTAGRAAEPGFVSVDVIDNGSGIPAHLLGNLRLLRDDQGRVGPRRAHEITRERIPHAESGRPFGEDMRAALALLRNSPDLRAAGR